LIAAETAGLPPQTPQASTLRRNPGIINNPPAGLISFQEGNFVSSAAVRPGSLVLYKIHPAIVNNVSDKIEITLSGGKSKRVRDKDVVLLHPGPLQSLGGLNATEPAIEEAWELLEGEQIGLSDLAELLYGDYTPATAWGAWQVLQDGLYFEGGHESIRRRSAEAVAEEKATRASRLQEEQEWDGFVQRVNEGALRDEDRKRLAEVERLALGNAANSRILKRLEIAESAESAHRFLLRCGYWAAEFNPWALRAGAALSPVDIGVPALEDEPRRDLTGLQAWAIDDAGNQDPDDAISIDGDRLWVHVADVAALVRPNGHMDLAARARGANLYLPDQIHGMLPDAVTEQLGLGLADQSPALSFGFRFDGDQVTDIEVTASWVRVQRATYDDIDQRMNEAPFANIRRITDAYRARRVERHAARIDLPEVSVRVVDGEVVIRPLPKLASRDMVTDAMLMAGEAAGRFAEGNAISIPYAMQPVPDEVRQPVMMSEMYGYRRLFKPSRVTLSPEPHFGLGLEVYARATSPLRRYADLVVHQQIRAFLRGQTPQSKEDLAERVALLAGAGAAIRKAERQSNQHWKLVFLDRNPGWEGEGVVLALEERKAVVVIPELGLETKVRRSDDMQLNNAVMMQLQSVDLPALDVVFRVR
jgi:exoribonuclease-2